jgi:hypothetical protein
MSSHSWLCVVRQAEEEREPSHLHERVMEAEYAILERMRELRSCDVSDQQAAAEFQDMRSALSNLLRIKTERLKWPALQLSDTDGKSA